MLRLLLATDRLGRPINGAARRRSGAVTIWLILVSGILLAALAVAINQARLWTIRNEMQNAADAACLAAADVLVDDDLLRGDPAFLPPLFQRSQAEAQLYAQFNIVQGQPFQLRPNIFNLPDGDIIFGTLDVPRSRQLFLASDILDPTNASLALVNTVRVRADMTQRRGNAPRMSFAQYVGLGFADVRAEAAAMLDRDVIGFRPLGDQVLPLAPLALFSDPTWNDPRSWQYQVQAQHGKDQFRYERFKHRFVPDPAGDGLFEFQAALALNADQQAQANVALVLLGVSDAGGVSWQLSTGINATDLIGMGGALVLGPDNRLTVPGSTQGPAFGSAEASRLHHALERLSLDAKPRIWPLYCGTGSMNQPILCGFVAARVVTVAPLADNQPLSFVLQPTMIAVPTALTDAARRGVGGIAITNPYVCKVRLVE